MPLWVVELFGSKQLNQAFWLINGLVAPFWILMIVFPRYRWCRWVCQPFFVPVLLGLFYLYMVYLLITVTGVPPLAGLEVRALRRFMDHPIVFLVIWTHYMTLELFLGMVVYQHAVRRRIGVPFELLLAWLFGPAGLVAYTVRLLWVYRSPRVFREIFR